VLIIGAGIAGISAALWCKRLGLHPVIIECTNQMGGQLHQIKNKIWDFPPHVYRNGQELYHGLRENIEVKQLDIRFEESLLSIDIDKHLAKTTKSVYAADYLMMATGVRHNSLSVMDTSTIVLDPWFSTTSEAEILKDKQVLVIGGGDRALESVFNLSAYAKHIWLAARSKRLRGRSEWVERIKHRPNVTIFMETVLLNTVETAEQTGAVLCNHASKESFFLPVDWILPRIGVRGNSDAALFLSHDGEGFLIADEYQRTSADWIYAIGDLTNGSAYASIALAAGQAMKAAKHISLRIKERNTYV